MKERDYEEVVSDIKKGHRTREEISENLLISSSTEEQTQRLILEVLLDIRDLLSK